MKRGGCPAAPDNFLPRPEGRGAPTPQRAPPAAAQLPRRSLLLPRVRPRPRPRLGPAAGPTDGRRAEGGERQRDQRTESGSRRERERASQRARERAQGPRRGLTMARGEARTRQGEATLSPCSPRTTSRTPARSPSPRCDARGLPTSAAGREAPGCGLRRSGGGGE